MKLTSANNKLVERKKESGYWKSQENRQRFCDSLYTKLEYKTFDDWTKLTKNILHQQNGASLLTHYYSNNIKQLLQSNYPNYPFNFRKPNETFRFLEYQQKFMENLYNKLNLTSLDDWLTIKRKNLIKNGAEKLLSKYYFNNFELLLQSVYPNFPWHFTTKEKFIRGKHCKYSDIHLQRDFLDFVFKNEKFDSLDDWLIISKHKLVVYGGRMILTYYKNDFEELLIKVYPNYPFQYLFNQLKLQNSFNFYFKNNNNNDNNDNDNNLNHNNLNNSYDEENINNNLINNYDDNNLNNNLDNINKDKNKLKLNVNKNYFYYYKKIKLKFWKSIKNQRKFMDDLFKLLKLKELNDWLFVSKNKIAKYGGQSLIKIYSNDMKKLLTTIYPNFNFSFELLKKRNSWQSYRSFSFHINQLNEIKKQYLIREKKDWFRIIDFKRNNICRSLKLVYPNENWNFSLYNRAKKGTQRYLYSMIQLMFPQYYLYENYRHPLFFKAQKNFEFDIFIPSIHFAVEYQGEQHYFDIPQLFNQVDFYLMFDQVKLKIAQKNSIFLMQIPFWWDRSFSSLYSTFIKSSFSLLKGTTEPITHLPIK